MAAEMWRVPVSKVHLGKGGSVIEDRGMLHKAQFAHNRMYLFSEAGVGVQDLALIGLWHEVLNFLATRPTSGIDNRIKTLPEIYMGLCYYRPGQRFTGLFPLYDAAASIVGQVIGIAGAGLGGVLPGPASTAGEIAGMVTEVVGGAKDLKDIKSESQSFRRKKPKPKKNMSLANNAVYIKFSYLQGDGMKKIGSGSVTFKALYPVILKALSDRA